jgi:hypothetical protein
VAGLRGGELNLADDQRRRGVAEHFFPREGGIALRAAGLVRRAAEKREQKQAHHGESDQRHDQGKPAARPGNHGVADGVLGGDGAFDQAAVAIWMSRWKIR